MHPRPPPCPMGVTKCMIPPYTCGECSTGCYAAPKVCCPDQFGHLIDKDACPTTNAGLCDPGLFVCATTAIPPGVVCPLTGTSCDANNCIYIFIRNLVQCEGVITPLIDKITFVGTKDAGSTEHTACNPRRNWSGPVWNIGHVGSPFPWPSGTCFSWFAGITSEAFIFSAPAGEELNICNDWTVVVCGFSSVTLQVHYLNVPLQFQPPPIPITIKSTACPEFGDNHGYDK